jgi:gluconokinase
VHKLVVMGVAGCGKSTLATQLSAALACRMIEGDVHHPLQNQEKMRKGIALDDSDREPWLDLLGAMMAEDALDAVLSCSALRRSYRDRLRARVPRLRFVYMQIDQAQAAQRVRTRPGHMFPYSLVVSQFEALESPVGEDGVISVSATLAPQEQVDAVMSWLAPAPGASGHR